MKHVRTRSADSRLIINGAIFWINSLHYNAKVFLSYFSLFSSFALLCIMLHARSVIFWRRIHSGDHVILILIS